MKITVQVVVDAQDGTAPVVHQASVIERVDLTPATAGLHLTEAHQVLSVLQDHLVDAQARTALAARADCPECGRPFRHKDTRTIVLRTLFGVAHLPCPAPAGSPARAHPARTRPSARWPPCCRSAPPPSCCTGRARTRR